MKTARIVLAPVTGRLEVRETSADLPTLQQLVGGYLQAVPLRRPPGLFLHLNEHPPAGLPVNTTLPLHVMVQLRVSRAGVLGQAFFARLDGGGELASVTDADLRFLGLARS